MERLRKAFTLIELLVVMSIISLLMSIMIPSLMSVQRQARVMLGVNNQREIVSAVSRYAMDHRDRYPESVATIGTLDGWWNWQEPRFLTGYRALSPRHHRSMSGYLAGYIEDPGIMYCPNSPDDYKYWKSAWDAGDEWDNPETAPIQDPAIGSYCFYWNYIGFLVERQVPFKGPRIASGRRGFSKVLVSDYFGYGHWRSESSYGSCEDFHRANITPGTWVSTAYWSRSRKADESNNGIVIELHAGYTDGHVEKYKGSEVITMKVSKEPDGSEPFPSGVGAGDFFLPRNCLY